MSKGKNKEILLLPIGKVMVDILNEIAVALRKSYGMHVRIGRAEEPDTQMYSDERRQFDAEKLIHMAKARKHDNLFAVLGIVDADVFFDEKSFVFSYHQSGTGLALLSLARLRQEFYQKTSDRELFLKRAVTEAFTQVGMAGGMPVCSQKKCVLSAGTSLWRLDEKRQQFCSSCSEKLQTLIEEQGKSVSRRQDVRSEDVGNEGPSGQPVIIEEKKINAKDQVEDESMIKEEVLHPDEPQAAEEEAVHDEAGPDEPLDANTQSE